MTPRHLHALRNPLRRLPGADRSVLAPYKSFDGRVTTILTVERLESIRGGSPHWHASASFGDYETGVAIDLLSQKSRDALSCAVSELIVPVGGDLTLAKTTHVVHAWKILLEAELFHLPPGYLEEAPLPL